MLVLVFKHEILSEGFATFLLSEDKGQWRGHGDLPDSPQPFLFGGETYDLQKTQQNEGETTVVKEHGLVAPGRERIIDVLGKEHLLELPFPLGPEATFPVIGRRVFESPEEHIPNRKIGEILVMPTPLVMDAMHFRALEKIADPAGSPDVHMVKVFPKGSIEQAPGPSFYRKTEQEIIDCPDNQGIDDDLARVLVKGGDGLDTAGAMMNLMEGQPEEVHVMAQPVPPIEQQGHHQIA